MAVKARDVLGLLLRVAITLVLLWWVFGRIDAERFVEGLRSTRWYGLAGVWAATLLVFLVAAVKMEYILRSQGAGAGLTTVFGASAASALYAMVMPGLLSTGVKWYILQKRTGSGAAVLSGMIYNQLSDLVVMLVAASAVLAATNPPQLSPSVAQNRLLLPVACGVLMVIVVVASCLAMAPATGGRLIRAVSSVGRLLPAAVGTRLQKLLRQIAVFQGLPWRFHFLVVLITIISRVAGSVLVYVLAAWAVNVSVSVIVLVWLSAAVMILRMLPISIANVGPREAVLVAVLGGYGIAASDALLMSLVLFSGSVFMAVVGGVFQVLWRPVPLADGEARPESP